MAEAASRGSAPPTAPCSRSRRWSTSSAAAGSAAPRRSPGRCCGCDRCCRSATARSRPSRGCAAPTGCCRPSRSSSRPLGPRPAAVRRLRPLAPAGGVDDLRALVTRVRPQAVEVVAGEVGPDRRHPRRPGRVRGGVRPRSAWERRPASVRRWTWPCASSSPWCSSAPRRPSCATCRASRRSSRPRRARAAAPAAAWALVAAEVALGVLVLIGPHRAGRRGGLAAWALGLVFAASLVRLRLRGAAARAAAASAAPASARSGCWPRARSGWRRSAGWWRPAWAPTAGALRGRRGRRRAGRARARRRDPGRAGAGALPAGRRARGAPRPARRAGAGRRGPAARRHAPRRWRRLARSGAELLAFSLARLPPLRRDREPALGGAAPRRPARPRLLEDEESDVFAATACPARPSWSTGGRRRGGQGARQHARADRGAHRDRRERALPPPEGPGRARRAVAVAPAGLRHHAPLVPGRRRRGGAALGARGLPRGRAGRGRSRCAAPTASARAGTASAATLGRPARAPAPTSCRASTRAASRCGPPTARRSTTSAARSTPSAGRSARDGRARCSRRTEARCRARRAPACARTGCPRRFGVEP